MVGPHLPLAWLQVVGARAQVRLNPETETLDVPQLVQVRGQREGCMCVRIHVGVWVCGCLCGGLDAWLPDHTGCHVSLTQVAGMACI